MKEGWLIVNGFLDSPKFEEIYQILIDAANRNNCSLRKITNDHLMSILHISSGKTDWRKRPDFVLFWDKDVKLAKMLEKEGFNVFNSANAIEICDDKSLTFIALKDTDIKMPVTFSSPLTFDKEFADYSFVLQVEKSIGYPMIIKENKGSFGNEVYLSKSFQETKEIINKMESNEFIMQEYIDVSKGESARLQVVGDRVVAAMKLSNQDDFKSNATNGGHMEKYSPTEEEINLALEVCDKIGLDFAGVDIMWDKEQRPILCEVNSNAHIKNIFDCTKIQVADDIIKHILERVS